MTHYPYLQSGAHNARKISRILDNADLERVANWHHLYLIDEAE
jgi:hypothetical protein